MAREIKFRIWNKPQNRMMLWPEASSCYLSDVERYSDIFEFMQYTGMKDKNGAEIYEGDVVRCRTTGKIKWPHQGVIEYLGDGDEGRKCGYFGINCGKNMDGLFEYTHFWNNEDFEVIGNIYETLELLK